MKIFLWLISGTIVYLLSKKLLSCIFIDAFDVGYYTGIIVSLFTISFVVPEFNKAMDKWLK